MNLFEKFDSHYVNDMSIFVFLFSDQITVLCTTTSSTMGKILTGVRLQAARWGWWVAGGIRNNVKSARLD